MNFYFTEHIVINNPSKETIMAGLGNAYQYGFVLLALIIVGIIVWFRKIKQKDKQG